jgi:hypothetical protein
MSVNCWGYFLTRSEGFSNCCVCDFVSLRVAMSCLTIISVFVSKFSNAGSSMAVCTASTRRAHLRVRFLQSQLDCRLSLPGFLKDCQVSCPVHSPWWLVVCCDLPLTNFLANSTGCLSSLFSYTRHCLQAQCVWQRTTNNAIVLESSSLSVLAEARPISNSTSKLASRALATLVPVLPVVLVDHRHRRRSVAMAVSGL